ncbi:MAG: TlpA disulfide reductase family protein [Bacteroidales bacterium]
MKKLILIAAILGLFACTSSKEEVGYTINVSLIGEQTEFKSDSLLLTNRSKEDTIKQVAAIVDGKCTFTGVVVTPETYTISFKGERSTLCRLFLENEKYEITIPIADLKETKILGGTTQQVINTINEKSQEIVKAAKLDSLMQAYGTATEQDKKMIESIYDKATMEIQKLDSVYISANPTSLYALTKFSQAIEEMPLDSAVAKLARFKAVPAYANNRNIKSIEKIINTIKSLQPGMQAPDFTQNDPEGNPVKFSDIYSKNKVTMVDFWASWCSPCRAFNPTLVKIYNNYSKKGFGIIGVSLDTKQDAWVKAISDDKLTWSHVSDLGGWQNAVGDLYYVKFVPQNIFVDQTGKIIKRHASEEEIVALLNENLK